MNGLAWMAGPAIGAGLIGLSLLHGKQKKP
jgi:hypothetical protein